MSARQINSGQRRPTVRRGLKKRGVLPSFGDIILPIVGIFAVVLLVIAGRQFFLNGMKTSPGISSTRAYAEAPAVIAERENKDELEIFSPPGFLQNTVSNEAKAESKENDKLENNNDFLAFAMPVTTSKPENTPASSPVQATRKSATAKSSSNTAVKKTSSQPQAKTASKGTFNQKMWRVQIGAYTNRAGAQEAANKIKKAGYNAIVYSNPASKHFKVWVQGGADKKSAENVVKAMQKLGYKGSFSFPPAK